MTPLQALITAKQTQSAEQALDEAILSMGHAITAYECAGNRKKAERVARHVTRLRKLRISLAS